MNRNIASDVTNKKFVFSEELVGVVRSSIYPTDIFIGSTGDAQFYVAVERKGLDQ